MRTIKTYSKGAPFYNAYLCRLGLFPDRPEPRLLLRRHKVIDGISSTSEVFSGILMVRMARPLSNHTSQPYGPDRRVKVRKIGLLGTQSEADRPSFDRRALKDCTSGLKTGG
jgi:hypothetical protein